MHPIVPLAHGQALSVGVLSYDGSLFYGLNADRETLPDVDRLAALIDPSLQQLVHTAPDRPELALLRRRRGRDSR